MSCLRELIQTLQNIEAIHGDLPLARFDEEWENYAAAMPEFEIKLLASYRDGSLLSIPNDERRPYLAIVL